MKRITMWRRLVQIVIVLLFCALPWLNMLGWERISGSMFAMDVFGIPFADPATAAQTAISGLTVQFWPLAAYYLGAFLSLLLAFFMGRVFCGWLCPYGLFSELAHWHAANLPASANARRRQWWSKTVLAAIIIGITAVSAFPMLSFISLPGELTLVPILAWAKMGVSIIMGTALIPLAVLCVELIVRRRLWCEVFCPQSVFLGFAAWALPGLSPGMRIRWQPRQCNCGSNNPCSQACTMNLNPRHKNGPPRRDCIMCLACVEACHRHGKALEVTFTRQSHH